MQWLTQHADAISTVSIIGGFLFWIKHRMEHRFDKLEEKAESISIRLARLEGRHQGYVESIPLIEAKQKRRTRRSKPSEV